VKGSDALRQAGLAFGDRSKLVTAGDWGRATPCDAWTVHDLVNHVVGGNVRYTMILHGEEDNVVLATHDVDALGSDPVGAFWAGLRGLTAAFALPGALAATVRHPKSGPMSGAQLRVLRVSELTIHAWDLARAIGADEGLDGDLVQWLYDCLNDVWDTIARSGLYAPPEPGREEAEPLQTRLLHLLGRRP